MDALSASESEGYGTHRCWRETSEGSGDWKYEIDAATTREREEEKRSREERGREKTWKGRRHRSHAQTHTLAALVPHVLDCLPKTP